MNVQLSPAQLAELNTITLTKRDKLLRLASLVRRATHPVRIFSNVEYMSVADKRLTCYPYSMFAIAASDGVFKDAGLQGESVAQGQDFFNLSNVELHAFSCDCGGTMSNEMMAQRIEAIAARA